MKTMVYVANSKQGGIDSFRLDAGDGRLTKEKRYMGEHGLSPLAVSPDRRFLYAVARTETPSVAAFAIDSGTGELHLLNTAPAGLGIAYMSVDAGGRFLLAASYHGGFVKVWALGRGGMIQPEPVCHLQPGRNPHCIVLDASNRYAYVPVLGNDQIAQYRFDAASGMLTPNQPPAVSTPREAGPRHLILSPDNRFAYLLNELSGELVRYGLDQRTGVLTEHQSVPILPPERALPASTYTPPTNSPAGGNSPTPVIWAADIRMTPDSRFVYVSERTGSTLSCFALDAVSGRADLCGVVDVEKQPRGFAIDDFGRYLLVAGEASNHLACHAVNGENGQLTFVERYETGVAPNWVEIVTWV